VARNNETLWDRILDAGHPARWSRTLSRLGGRIQGLPREVIRMDFPELSRLMGRQLQSQNFDLVQFEYTVMAQYLDVVRAYSPQTAVVLEEIDISYIAMQRTLDFETGADCEDLSQQLDCMRHFERAQWKRVDSVAVMSQVERLKVLEECDESHVFVVPNGVDIAYFSFAERKQYAQPHILFLGSLFHSPNRIGLKAFLTGSWPKIRNMLPGVRLDVVGEGASEDLLSFASESVIFHGFIEDIRAVFADSSLLVVPIWTGSGTRLKVLEAFASGLPVVSTHLGCEGLNAKPDEHFLVAESPGEFADTIEALILKPDLGRKLASRARSLVEKLYDWDVVAGQAEEAWKAAIQNLQPPP